MKKIFSVILGFMLCATLFCNIAHAVPPSPNDNVLQFITKISNIKDKFVFDSVNCDRLTTELDKSLPQNVSLRDRRKRYHDAVQNILNNGDEVKYNCKVLSAWVWYELRNYNPIVDCKQLIIVSRNENGSINKHSAVLIPFNVNGIKKWYVCDLFYMAQFNNFDFANAELNKYIGAFGNMLIGMIVVNDEYISRDNLTGFGNCGGCDIAAWLASDGNDRLSALEALRSQKTDKIKIMSSTNTLAMDTGIILSLASLSPELSQKLLTKGVDSIVLNH